MGTVDTEARDLEYNILYNTYNHNYNNNINHALTNRGHHMHGFISIT